MPTSAPRRSQRARNARRKRKEKRAEAASQRRKQTDAIHQIFLECDVDNTGMLTDGEVKNFLKKINSSMEDEEALHDHELEHATSFVLHAADTDNDGGIAFPELVPAYEAFHNWTLKKDGMRAQVEELMVKHDEDQSGTLDKEELSELMTELNLGVKVSDAVYEKIWQSADKNGDGRVDLMELAPALSMWDQGTFVDLDGKQTSKYAVTGRGGDGWLNSGGGGGGKGGCCVVQ